MVRADLKFEISDFREDPGVHYGLLEGVRFENYWEV